MNKIESITIKPTQQKYSSTKSQTLKITSQKIDKQVFKQLYERVNKAPEIVHKKKDACGVCLIKAKHEPECTNKSSLAKQNTNLFEQAKSQRRGLTLCRMQAVKIEPNLKTDFLVDTIRKSVDTLVSRDIQPFTQQIKQIKATVDQLIQTQLDIQRQIKEQTSLEEWINHFYKIVQERRIGARRECQQEWLQRFINKMEIQFLTHANNANMMKEQNTQLINTLQSIPDQQDVPRISYGMHQLLMMQAQAIESKLQ